MLSFLVLGACSPSGEIEQPENKEYCSITFVQENESNIVKQVEKGEALTDIPTPTAKTGYNVAWSINDFSNITEDITVEAIYTAKVYKIYLQSKVDFDGAKEIEVKFNEIPELPTPVNQDKDFIKWVYEDGTDYQPINYTIDGDLTLIAVWANSGWYGPF
jgi:hypothetical protein